MTDQRSTFPDLSHIPTAAQLSDRHKRTAQALQMAFSAIDQAVKASAGKDDWTPKDIAELAEKFEEMLNDACNPQPFTE